MSLIKDVALPWGVAEELGTAISANDCSRVEGLLQAYPGIIRQPYEDNANQTWLHRAIEANSVDVIGLLVRSGHPVDLPEGNYGYPPAGFAVHMGHPQALKALLAAGADPNEGWDDKPPLHALQRYTKGDMFARIFVEHGCDKEALLQGYTPLFAAALKGRIPMIRVLLAAGADTQRLCRKQSLIEVAKRSRSGFVVEEIQTWLAAHDARRAVDGLVDLDSSSTLGLKPL